MFPALQFGRLFGIPLEARVSFLLMLAAVLLFMGGVAGVVVVLVAFASVVLHELGHALTARKLGVGVSGIELHFFGGVAKLTSQPKSARDEALIAAAGPAVSFVLAALGYLMYAATGLGGFALLGAVNLIIALFNLLPALPMDGGRIFRALMSRRYGYQRATEIAVKLSRVTSIAFGVFGLAFMHLQLILLAGVLWAMASAEKKAARFGAYGRAQEMQQERYYRDPQTGTYWRSSGQDDEQPPAERIVIHHYNQRRN